jgi:Icc-related predicted phosphoesterase
LPQPTTWAELRQAYLLECRAPPDLRVQAEPRQIGEALFRLEGARLVREGPNREHVVVGMLSALKDVTPETRANVARATAAFRQAGVDVIVANGDVALNEFDLEAAMDLLGETGLPVLVLIGNSEGRGAFNRAFVAAEARHPNLFNMNWVRHVQLGRVDLVSLPGYYNRPFIHQNSGCHYDAAEVEAVGRYLEPLQRAGRTPVLVAHGPPKSRGKAAIDRAFEYGNVGDPEMLKLIVERKIPYGLYGHILEAGGRASSDVRLGTPAKPGKPYRRLYVNAGAASAMPWKLLDGKTATGMAMIVRFDGKGARYQVLKL